MSRLYSLTKFLMNQFEMLEKDLNSILEIVKLFILAITPMVHNEIHNEAHQKFLALS